MSLLQVEYYLCIQTQRLGYDISFSEQGGMDIEANWDQVRHACPAETAGRQRRGFVGGTYVCVEGNMPQAIPSRVSRSMEQCLPEGH